MAFSSYTFLFLFLPFVCLVYFLIPSRFRTARNLFLTAASFAFCFCGGVFSLAMMLFSVIVSYAGGLLCEKGKRKKVWFFVSVTAELLMLAGFKYTGFFCETLVSLGAKITVPSIILPVGISFFTFQGISYVSDVCRGEIPAEKNFLKVSLYLSMFPQLIAGPIVRYRDVSAVLDEKRESLAGVSDGLTRFCFGLGKKLLLADVFGSLSDEIFLSPASLLPAPAAWLGALAFTLRIYYDFSGYTDMALGLGKVFGFSYPENFDHPYLAVSVTDFWHRWHITLSRWFRDYVYIPLGGSRGSTVQHIRNLLIVWGLTGLWHGAGWNFLLWGLFWGLLLIGEKYVWHELSEKLPRAVGWLFTMLAIVLGWTVFRAESLGDLWNCLRAMTGFGAKETGMALYGILEYLPEWIFGIVFCLPIGKYLSDRVWHEGYFYRIAPKAAALFVFALSYVKLITDGFDPFLYFRF